MQIKSLENQIFENKYFGEKMQEFQVIYGVID